MQTDDLDGNECDYDNAVYDKNIQRFVSFGLRGNQSN
jgi:hypothetical protein